jgi:hypothetical protein
MKPLYSKIIFAIALIAAISILVVGTILGISGLIMGGVIGLFGSAMLGMSLMINNSTSIKETPTTPTNNTKDTVVIITNPMV